MQVLSEITPRNTNVSFSLLYVDLNFEFLEFLYLIWNACQYQEARKERCTGGDT